MTQGSPDSHLDLEVLAAQLRRHSDDLSMYAGFLLNSLSGAFGPLTKLLAVLQGGEPMPYTGDYVVAENIATSGDHLNLLGDMTATVAITVSAVAGVAMYASRYAVCTENGPELVNVEPLLSGGLTS